jgi:c-di-GMP-binding flagellar brake protein YcgR
MWPFSRTETKVAERRTTPRYNIELHLTVMTKNGRTVRGISREMSGSGMGAVLTGDLETGEEVQLRYQFDDGSPPQVVRALVRHRQGRLYGFEFLF